jgi:putative transposase
MVNHVHFIVTADDAHSVSKTFQLVHMRYAQYMLGKRKSSGHLWQGRFYSCPMDEPHLYRAIRYVERNPVRSRMVQKAWRYPWSSASWHIGAARTSAIVLTETALIGKNEWKEYLVEGDEGFKMPPGDPLS